MEKRRASNRRWAENNRERQRELVRAWQREHPEASVRCRRKYGSVPRHLVKPMPPWTAEETEMVLRRDLTDEEISARIGRTVTAIKVRRSKCHALARMGGHA